MYFLDEAGVFRFAAKVRDYAKESPYKDGEMTTRRRTKTAFEDNLPLQSRRVNATSINILIFMLWYRQNKIMVSAK